MHRIRNPAYGFYRTEGSNPSFSANAKPQVDQSLGVFAFSTDDFFGHPSTNPSFGNCALVRRRDVGLRQRGHSVTTNPAQRPGFGSGCLSRARARHCRHAQPAAHPRSLASRAAAPMTRPVKGIFACGVGMAGAGQRFRGAQGCGQVEQPLGRVDASVGRGGYTARWCRCRSTGRACQCACRARRTPGVARATADQHSTLDSAVGS